MFKNYDMSYRTILASFLPKNDKRFCELSFLSEQDLSEASQVALLKALKKFHFVNFCDFW